MQQVKDIPMNTPFIESLAKVPEYEDFLQDLLDTHQQLEKTSKVFLRASFYGQYGGNRKEMGDPRRLTLPCEFGNSTKTFALADLEQVLI